MCRLSKFTLCTIRASMVEHQNEQKAAPFATEHGPSKDSIQGAEGRGMADFLIEQSRRSGVYTVVDKVVK